MQDEELTDSFRFRYRLQGLNIQRFTTLFNKRPVGLSSFVNCPPVVASFLTQRQLSVIAG